MVHKGGNCTASYGCTCSEGSRDYSVTSRVAGLTAEWALSVILRDGRSFQESVHIDHEKSSPRIDSISLLSGGKPVISPVSQNSTVTIVCSWDSGYPPMTSLPRLIDPRGKELGVTYKTSHVSDIKHIIESIQCEDSGMYVCEMDDGASRKSATLLVKCAPSFAGVKDKVFHVAPRGSLYLQFPVRGHSASLQQCELKGELADVIVMFKSCQSSDRSLGLVGSPPDMTLQLNLTNVTTTLNGTWTLGLGNDVGVGYLTFAINITSDVNSGSSDNIPNITATHMSSLGLIIVVVGGVLVVIAITAIIFACALVRRKGSVLPPPAPHTFRRATAPGPGDDVSVVFRAARVLRESHGSQRPVTDPVYTEIPDNEIDESPNDNTSPEPENGASIDYLNATAPVSQQAATTEDSITVETTVEIHATETYTNAESLTGQTNDEDEYATNAMQLQRNDPGESQKTEEIRQSGDEETETRAVESSGSKEPPYENTVGVLMDN